MTKIPKSPSTQSTSLQHVERPSRPKNPTRLQQLEISAAERVVRKEIAALSRLKDRDAATIAREATTFLQAHQAFVEKTMLISERAANAHVREIARDLSLDLSSRTPSLDGFLRVWEEIGVDELLLTARRDQQAQQQQEKKAPNQPAPASAQQITIPVTIVNQMPAALSVAEKPAEMHILSMPDRESISTTERDKQDRITRVKQTEKDA